MEESELQVAPSLLEVQVSPVRVAPISADKMGLLSSYSWNVYTGRPIPTKAVGVASVYMS